MDIVPLFRHPRGTDTTLQRATYLVALNRAGNKGLSETAMFGNVERVGKELFGTNGRLFATSPLCQSSALEEMREHGFVEKITPFAWIITSEGCEYLANIILRFLRPVYRPD